jgi:hypothetical protein
MAQETILSSHWEQVENDTLAETVYHIEGKCPHCGHDTYWKVHTRRVWGLMSLLKSATHIEVRCICNNEKDKVPVEGTGRTGCGWHAPISLEA